MPRDLPLAKYADLRRGGNVAYVDETLTELERKLVIVSIAILIPIITALLIWVNHEMADAAGRAVQAEAISVGML